jgi:hypothetical protein
MLYIFNQKIKMAKKVFDTGVVAHIGKEKIVNNRQLFILQH